VFAKGPILVSMFLHRQECPGNMLGIAIIRKDLLLLARDRRTLVTLLIMPLIFIAILGFSTGRLLGWQAENATLSIAVANASGGPIADRLIAALNTGRGVEVRPCGSAADARRLVRDGTCTAAVVIGPGFAGRTACLTPRDVLDPTKGRLAAGPAALDVQVFARASAPGAGDVVEQLVWAQTLRAVTPGVLRRDPEAGRLLAASALAPATQPGLVADAVDSPPASAATIDGGPAASPGVYQILVPSYTVMFTFFLVNLMARSFIAERSTGTLNRLRLAPISSAAILCGKTLPFLLVSVIQGGLLFLSGRLLFGMSWGTQPGILVVVIACTSLAATGVGLLTATLVRSDAQVSAYATLLVITLAGVSGCLMPRDWLPELMRQISLATPHAWALIAYDQLLGVPQPDLARVARCCAVLLAFTGACFAGGWWRFRALR